MKLKFVAASCCLAIALAAAAGNACGQAVPSSAPYICGGADSASRAEMKARARQFDVHAVFALRSGQAVSGVEVVVRDTSGTTFVATVAAGPWFYTDLPPGSYEMTASLGPQSLTQRFVISADGYRELTFRFLEE